MPQEKNDKDSRDNKEPDEGRDPQGSGGGTDGSGGDGGEGRDGDRKRKTPDMSKLFEEHPELSSEIDRRVTSAVKKRDMEWEQRMQSEKERAKREAEEAKLLEEGKIQELLEKRTKEYEETKQELDRLLHAQKVEKLLDKHEIEDAYSRDILKKMGQSMDLKELDEEVKRYTERFTEVIANAVEKKLGSAGAPHRKKGTPETHQELAQRIQELQREGKWEDAMRLKFEISDQQVRAAGSVGGGGAPAYNPFPMHGGGGAGGDR